MSKRRFSMFRRGEDESSAANGGGSEESRNGVAVETAQGEAPTGLFDREADTNEFTVPGLASSGNAGAAHVESEDVTGDRAAPAERRFEPRQRTTTNEWHVDDGPEDELQPEAFLPSIKPAAPEAAEAEPADPRPDETEEPKEGAEAPEPQAPTPASGPAVAAERPAPAPAPKPAAGPADDASERIRRAELAARKAAEQRAMDEINALEEDLDLAKREGAARAEALEVKLNEAERRADEAEERAAAAQAQAAAAEPGAGAQADPRALEEQAREGAAKWLRERERELEVAVAEARRETEDRVRQEEQEKQAARLEAARAEAQADRDRAVGKASKLRKELDRVSSEADTRLKREVDAARATTETEARETLRTREEELIRERAAIEGELAATRRQLVEAHERAVAAERHATEVEIEARREIEREREEIAPPAWVMDGPTDEPEVEAEPEGMLSLSSASFEELRDIGMSVTQAKRVLRHREEHDGFGSIEELDEVPGFPKSFLAGAKDRLVP